MNYLPQNSWNHGSKEDKSNILASFFLYGSDIDGGERLHLMLSHQSDRGILSRRMWGSIFIKGISKFEAKKAVDYELELHSHGGWEERNGDGRIGEGGRIFEG